MRHCRRDHGQAVMLLLVVVALATLSLIAIGTFSQRIVERSRAQTAADAAALAGTTGGRTAAVSLAARNGGRLVAYRTVDGTVVVVVVVDGEVATARATNGP